jgi:hypothetical protein
MAGGSTRTPSGPPEEEKRFVPLDELSSLHPARLEDDAAGDEPRQSKPPPLPSDTARSKPPPLPHGDDDGPVSRPPIRVQPSEPPAQPKMSWPPRTSSEAPPRTSSKAPPRTSSEAPPRTSSEAPPRTSSDAPTRPTTFNATHLAAVGVALIVGLVVGRATQDDAPVMPPSAHEEALREARVAPPLAATPAAPAPSATAAPVTEPADDPPEEVEVTVAPQVLPPPTPPRAAPVWPAPPVAAPKPTVAPLAGALDPYGDVEGTRPPNGAPKLPPPKDDPYAEP